MNIWQDSPDACFTETTKERIWQGELRCKLCEQASWTDGRVIFQTSCRVNVWRPTHLTLTERAAEQIAVAVDQVAGSGLVVVGRASSQCFEAFLGLLHLRQVARVGHVQTVVGRVKRHSS